MFGKNKKKGRLEKVLEQFQVTDADIRIEILREALMQITFLPTCGNCRSQFLAKQGLEDAKTLNIEHLSVFDGSEI